METIVKDRFLLRNERYSRSLPTTYRSPIFAGKGKDKSIVDAPVPVEQRFSKEFNCKPNGHPSSDISRLLSSTSAIEIQQMVQKFASMPSSTIDGKALTTEQKYAAIKPRLCDTPLERERYFTYMNDTFGRSANDLFGLSEKLEKDADKSITESTAEADRSF